MSELDEQIRRLRTLAENNKLTMDTVTEKAGDTITELIDKAERVVEEANMQNLYIDYPNI